MAKLPIDFSNLKKIKEDGKSATFKHKDGHEFKVAKNALNPKLRNHISKLPISDEDKDPTQEHLLPGDKQSNKIEKSVVNKAKAHFDNGGGVTTVQKPEGNTPGVVQGSDSDYAAFQASQTGNQPQTSASPTSGPSKPVTTPTAKDQAITSIRNAFNKGGTVPPSSYSEPNPKLAESKKTPRMYADGDVVTQVDPTATQTGPSESANPTADEIVQEANSQPPQQPMAKPMSASPDSPQPQQPQQDTSVASNIIPDSQNMMQQGFEEKVKGIGQQAKAEAQLGQQQAADYKAQNQPLADLSQHFQAEAQKNNDYSKQLIESINNQTIDPNHFYENQSTANKITTGIGLLLGGLGGINGQPNQAVAFLNQQIDRDIDAQKANIGKSQGLLAANMQSYHNIEDAATMTKKIMQDQVMNQLNQAAAANKSPQAKAAAQQAIGQLQMEQAPIMQNFNLNRALVRASQSPGSDSSSLLPTLRVLNPERAKQVEEHTVPGIPGQSTIPLTPDARNDLTSKQLLDQSLDRYIDFAQKNAGSLDPRIVAQGNALAADLNGKYRNATHGGVYKEGESAFIQNSIDPNPTKFFNNIRGVIPKAMELKQNNLASLNALKGQYYGPQSQTQQSQQQSFNPQQQAIISYAKAHPENPNSAKVLKKLGIQ